MKLINLFIAASSFILATSMAQAQFMNTLKEAVPSSVDATFLTATVAAENEEFRSLMPITIGLWEEGGVTKSLIGISDSTEAASTQTLYSCSNTPTITAAYQSAISSDTFRYVCSNLTKVNIFPGPSNAIFTGIHPTSFKSIELYFERPKGKMLTTSSGAISKRFKVYERTSGTMRGYAEYRNGDGTVKSVSLTPLSLTQGYSNITVGHSSLKSSISNLPNGSTSTFYASVPLPNGDDLIYDIATLKGKYEITIVANASNGYSMPLFNFYVAPTSTTLNNIKLILPYSYPSGNFTVTINVKEKTTGKQFVEHYWGYKN